MNKCGCRAIVIGDSTNNTLSIIRSLGEAKIAQCLILKCSEDTHFVAKSKYLRGQSLYRIEDMAECLLVLEELKSYAGEQTIICSFDEAAVFIDVHEHLLSPFFRTPSHGRQIGTLFNKDEQCKLAAECGLIIPKSRYFNRADEFEFSDMEYPVILKPQNSTRGEKSDIHICNNSEDIEKALAEESECSDFVLQEFISKDYELDCIGVRTEQGTYIPGGVRKIRHYPRLIGAGAYGRFMPAEEIGVDVDGVSRFLEKVGYYGPFSVEFVHKDGVNYFMEVNFRNEGLAYAATCAGANLHALYLDPDKHIDHSRLRSIYMMNYSLDFLYVKHKELPLHIWIRDFLRTRCFINMSFRDMSPTIHYYFSKIKRRHPDSLRGSKNGSLYVNEAE